MKPFIFITAITFLLCSCFNSNEKRQLKFSHAEIASLKLDSTKNIRSIADSIKTFNLNPLLGDRGFDFGGTIKSIKFVPLETTDESLISEIGQIIITDSNIYIRTDHILNNVLIFDKSGKYIKQIQKGQGPEEILDLKGIAYDNNQEELIVYHNKFLSFFTKDGKFKKKEKIPLNAHGFTLIPDGYLFQAGIGFDNRHLGYSDEYQIFITDKSFRLVSKGFPHHFSKENNHGADNMSTNTNPINIDFVFIDTIYQFIDNYTMKAKYFFDISSKKIPEKILLTASHDDLQKAMEQNDYSYYTGKFEETDTHIHIAYWNIFIGYRSIFFIDKKTKNIIGGTGMLYQSKDFPVLSPPIAAKGSYFISRLQPHDIIPRLVQLNNPMISKEDFVKLKALKEDDNPVLIFYELKSF